MKETTQLTDAEYRFYERLKLSRDSIKPHQVHTCRHCCQPYKINKQKGSSEVQCGDEACKLAERIEQKKAENMRRTTGARLSVQSSDWKHNTKRLQSKERRILQQAAGFCYV